MEDKDVYFDDGKERVTKANRLLDEIVSQGENTHLERMDKSTAYLGVSLDDGTRRKFLIKSQDDSLFVIPYEEKSDEGRAGVGN